MSVSMHGPRADGTFMGVPFSYSIEKNKYRLVDGMEFDGDQYGRMIKYIESHLGTLVVGAKGHKDVMRAISGMMEQYSNDFLKETITSSTTTSNGGDDTLTTEKLLKSMETIKTLKTSNPPSAHKDFPIGVNWNESPFSPPSKDDMLNEIRYQLTRENAKIQKEWDRLFNKEVLKLVRLAIEQGSATWHYTVPKVHEINTLGSATAQHIVGREVVKIEIRYNPFMTEQAAYRDIREQAEKAVRQSLEPPQLNKLP